MSPDTGKITMKQEILKVLHDTLSGHAGVEWLFSAAETLQTAPEPLEQLSLFSAKAIRTLGDDKLAPIGQLLVETDVGQIDVGGWSVGDCGRVFLIMSLVAERQEDSVAHLSGFYRIGDERERAALVRGLALLSDRDEHKSVALNAGRTNSIELFKALAIDNPYPAAYYSDHEFNQMVLKAMFMEIGICRVHGLAKRANPALSVMCENYYDERCLAGRKVPVDIWLALGPCATEYGEQILVRAASSPDTRERSYACEALGQRARVNPQLMDILEQRLIEESQPEIIKCLKRHLAQ